MPDSGHPFVDQNRALAKVNSIMLFKKAYELLQQGKTDDEVFFYLLYSLDMINDEVHPGAEGKFGIVVAAETILQMSMKANSQ